MPIEVYGNPVLVKKAEKITEITQEIVDLAQKMVRTMHRAPGLGLAAPQVNVSKRLITVDLSLGENENELYILINPEIMSRHGIINEEEGCLSVPGIREIIRRPANAVVKGIDLDGNEKTIEAQDFLARVFTHEIDHINGVLFIDHLSPLKKSLVRKKLKKQLAS
jgi:peptide deformylase